MALRRRRLDDVETLRAFSHPLRTRLLGLLRTDGPATASELGRRVGESSGSTSYHLRQLERFGFVAEDEDQPSKRERRWRAAPEVTGWHSGESTVSDAGRIADAVVRRHRLRDLVDQLEGWESEQHAWAPAWHEAAGHSDLPLFLRPGDVRALTAELESVILRYAENSRPADDPEAGPVAVHVLTIPVRGPTPREPA